MNKMKPIINFILILFLFIALHNAIIIGLGNAFSLFRENNEIELVQSAYEGKIEDLERQITEYERANRELKMYEGSSFILSKIAIRNIYDFYDYLIISTASATEKGDAVVNEDGLVGIISSANKLTAKVELITGGSEISVKVGDNYGMLGEYDKKERLFKIHNIDNYKVVTIGDEVTTSGLQQIDAGIRIGTVTKIDNEGVEQIVYVAPSVNYEELNYLIVISR